MWRFLKLLMIVVVLFLGISEDLSAQEKNESVFVVAAGASAEADGAKQYAQLAEQAFKLLGGAWSWDVDLKVGEVAGSSIAMIINTIGGFHFPATDTVKLISSYRDGNRRMDVLATNAFAKKTRTAYLVTLQFRGDELKGILWKKSADPPFTGFVVHSLTSERQINDISSDVMRFIFSEYAYQIIDSASVENDNLNIHHFLDGQARLKYSVLYSTTTSESRVWNLGEFLHTYISGLPDLFAQSFLNPTMTSTREVFDIWCVSTFLKDFLIVVVYDGAELQAEDFGKIVAGGSR